jgi:multiple sugar transport system permease protein
MSFTKWDIIQSADYRGLTNYREAIFEDPRFWNSVKVTSIYTVASVPLGLIFALALALLLNTKVRGMPLYRTMFYLPALASAVASALIWRKIFQPDGGLLNLMLFGSDGLGDPFGLRSMIGLSGELPNWLGDERLALPSLIIMSLWGVGGGMVILLAGLQSIPDFYYEAATLDGAGIWSKFKVVTLPLLSPSLFFTLITGVIGSFQVFTQAFVMTQGGPNDSTRFYMLHLYEQSFGSLRMGYASALAWLLFGVIFLMTRIQWSLNKYVYYEGGA